MSMVKIRQALETGLSTITPALATAYENVPYAPVTGTPYQTVYMLFNNPDNPTLGDGFYRERGIMQVSLKYPLNNGSTACATRVELVRQKFKRGATFTKDGITVTIDKTPSVSFMTEADRYTAVVKIYFYSDIFNT